jgi:predicted nucleic acid-binding protein
VGPLILDATVLVALADERDAHHGRAVGDLEAAERGGRVFVAPASAYSEALVRPAAAGALARAAKMFAAMGIAVAPLTASMAEGAAALRARHKRLPLPDALVLACARELGGELMTFDRRLAGLR